MYYYFSLFSALHFVIYLNYVGIGFLNNIKNIGSYPNHELACAGASSAITVAFWWCCWQACLMWLNIDGKTIAVTNIIFLINNNTKKIMLTNNNILISLAMIIIDRINIFFCFILPLASPTSLTSSAIKKIKIVTLKRKMYIIILNRIITNL